MCPDELTADFWARYGRDWRGLGLWEAAALAWPLLSRPEYETCRVLNPDTWFWLDPMFHAVAGLAGVKPPKKHANRTGKLAGFEVMDTDQVDRVLAGQWTPVDK